MRDNSKKEYRWLHLISLSIILFLIGCSAFFKPNLLSNLEISDLLENDKNFFHSDGKEFEDKEVDKYFSKMKKYSIQKSEESQNLYGIYSAKNSQVLESQKIFLEIINKYNNKYYLLNYIRLMYLIDDYSNLRKNLKVFIEKNKENRDLILEISSILKKKERKEENTIYLGVVAELPNFEKLASMELGEFFFNTGDFNSARQYYEKILNSYSYDIVALDSLLTISIYEEKYQDAIAYGKVLRKENFKNKEFYLNLCKAYYEEGEYEEIVSFFGEIPEKDKMDRSLLWYYRNSILSIDPSANISKINKYIDKSREDRRDLDLEYSFSENGISIYKRVFKGY